MKPILSLRKLSASLYRLAIASHQFCPEEAVKLASDTIRVLKSIERLERVSEIYAKWAAGCDPAISQLAIKLCVESRGRKKLRKIWSALEFKTASEEKVIGDLWFIIARHIKRASSKFSTKPSRQMTGRLFCIKTTLCDCGNF